MKVNLSLVFFFSLIYLYGQAPQWLVTYGGPGDERAKVITTDSQQNAIIAGNFEETVDFDPGPNTLDLTSAGNNDAYIQKLDVNGELLWVKRFGGAESIEIFGIDTDSAGNIFLVGGFKGQADFDPSILGFYNLTSLGSWDIYVVKLDAQGNFIWAKQIGSPDLEYGADVAVDNAGNIYLDGWFKNDMDFDPGAGEDLHTAKGLNDVFIIKLDTNGQYVWGQQFGGASQETARGLFVKDNLLFVSGSFSLTATYGTATAAPSLTSQGGKDGFLLQLDTAGNYLWGKSFGGSSSDEVREICLDDQNNIYLTGKVSGNADLDPGSTSFMVSANAAGNTFVAKLTPNAQFLWATLFNGTNTNIGYSLIFHQNHLNLAGYFKDTISIPQIDNTMHDYISNGDNDAYIADIDPTSGLTNWFYPFGGTGNEQVYMLSPAGTGQFYAIGRFQSSVNFDGLQSNSLVTSNGGYDAFVLKIAEQTDDIQPDFFSNIEVYPNPGNGLFKINLAHPQKAKIKVWNTKGQLIYNQKTSGNQHILVQLPKKDGMYLLQIQLQTSSKFYKLFVN